MKKSTLTVNITIREWCMPLLVVLVLLRIPVPKWMFVVEKSS